MCRCFRVGYETVTVRKRQLKAGLLADTSSRQRIKQRRFFATSELKSRSAGVDKLSWLLAT
ncbi:MAG: hypothetical protein ACREPE_12325 [Lysobacter sp.]